MNWRILTGDVREKLAEIPAGSVQCCVTSPPYWGLRDYGNAGQIGLETTPDLYVASLVEVFAAVRRVLADDGTLWLNLGDSYASSPPGNTTKGVSARSTLHGVNGSSGVYRDTLSRSVQSKRNTIVDGLKPKDLVGIPWRVAFALQADGWYLRSDIIWHKPNPMPESVTDRPTKAHEYLFLFAKSARYYYDADAIREPNTEDMKRRFNAGHTRGARGKVDASRQDADTLRGDHAKALSLDGRNRRSVWTVPPASYPDAHFATYPPALIEPCILAGSKPGDLILDPFNGSGTTGEVAIGNQRNYVGIEINPAYVELAWKRIGGVAPMFSTEISA